MFDARRSLVSVQRIIFPVGWMAAVLLFATVTAAVADEVVVTSKTADIKSGNKTFKEALAEYEKIEGAPTLLSQHFRDGTGMSKNNYVSFQNHKLVHGIQKKKGKKECFDLQKAFNRQ